ncbi:cobalamin-dependent protein [Candidatus Fermentibacteria bacterium]|nr:cobalamin-dependent protein [Candidatus Fermentibacteria bacterium]
MLSDDLIERANQTVLGFDTQGAVALVEELISSGGDLLELMDRAYIPAIGEIGERFSCGQVFLPELIQAANVMKAVTEMVSRALPKEATRPAGAKFVIGTVEGDIHDIGKTLVVTLLEVHGFTVYDLGRDVSSKRLIAKAVEVDAGIIGTSALLSTTMEKQKELVQALTKPEYKGRFKTMVGGAPVTRRWAERIGADGYGENAHEAVVKAKELSGP